MNFNSFKISRKMAEKSFQKFDKNSIFSRNHLKEWVTCGDNFSILTDWQRCKECLIHQELASKLCRQRLQDRLWWNFSKLRLFVSKKHQILKMFQISVFLLQINIKTWKVFTRIPKNLLKFVENLSRSSKKNWNKVRSFEAKVSQVRVEYPALFSMARTTCRMLIFTYPSSDSRFCQVHSAKLVQLKR